MVAGKVSRRSLIGTGAALGVALPVAGLGAGSAAADKRGHGVGRYKDSIRSAVHFLQQVTDAYRTTGLRLAQSYQDQSGLTDIAFIYDNALTAIALLSAGDVARAQAIGDALLYAQNHDAEFTDFRLRQAYHSDGFIDPAGVAVSGYQFGLVGTAVGDMAWTAIALAQLAKRTKDARYAQGAIRIGEWIFTHTYSNTGLGGYTFGETAGLEDHKSSEHNIDVYALFRLLATLTGKGAWNTRADHAWEFVRSVWNADDEFFWTGSDDGFAINKAAAQLPEDPQTWSWLAARDRRYADSIDWAATNLAATDTPLRANSALRGNYCVTGVAFASGSLITDPNANIGGQSYNPKPDVAAVWFEGTAQLATALVDRDRSGDDNDADTLLATIRSAQGKLGSGQVFGGKVVAPGGIVAASSPMDTGFGFGYYPNLHIAATSWYLFAATGVNPYRFI